MVTILASHNVTPNQPTPTEPLWLSDSDQIGFLAHIEIDKMGIEWRWIAMQRESHYLKPKAQRHFGEYGDFSPSDSTEELVPKVDYRRSF
ncbi:unnamed protein product [Sphenostylis stenocarpa]|uniref:Uncharacterized protein n=1 Tax=Sphenostylis stenocarpa TaxID=92480 RepID=A0AA86STF4_9FABA|nr:unnamed protein product [Sphenostylis stenocarpa]